MRITSGVWLLPALVSGVPTEQNVRARERVFGERISTRLSIPAFDKAGIAVYHQKAVPFAEPAVLEGRHFMSTNESH
jgi:hypothetical protein